MEGTEDLDSHPIVQRLRRGEFCNVVVLAGAGISVSAGIPDFRSPGTGLYENLQEYDLPEPEAIFSLSYFRQNPEPFTRLAKELWPVDAQPTVSHLFVRVLERKGFLRRHFTQNIDGLDSAAGISEQRLVKAHGSFGAGHCIDCNRAFHEDRLREHIFGGKVARCSCKGLVKPDIVFFGEDLPAKFRTCSKQDFDRCDLVLCMGTSLQVEPFASLVTRAPACVPRILINLNLPEAFRRRPADLVLLGECDHMIWKEDTLMLILQNTSASSLAWSFAKLGVQDSGELFQALAEELEGRLAGELTAQGLANVAWAFGTAAGLASFARTAEQSGLFRVIAREAAGKLRTFRPKELTNLLQAFARAKDTGSLQMAPELQQLLEASVKTVAEKAPDCDPRDLCIL
ncbi:unnamed protein product, partial [Polarella glacialis]